MGVLRSIIINLVGKGTFLARLLLGAIENSFRCNRSSREAQRFHSKNFDSGELLAQEEAAELRGQLTATRPSITSLSERWRQNEKRESTGSGHRSDILRYSGLVLRVSGHRADLVKQVPLAATLAASGDDDDHYLDGALGEHVLPCSPCGRWRPAARCSSSGLSDLASVSALRQCRRPGAV